MRVGFLSLLFLCVLLAGSAAGCIGNGSYTFLGSGSGTWGNSFGCSPNGAAVRLSLDIDAVGPFTIRLADGAGTLVFDEAYAGTTELEATHTLPGERGTWRVTLDRGEGFDGRVKMTTKCIA